jgi:hypothetical protein
LFLQGVVKISRLKVLASASRLFSFSLLSPHHSVKYESWFCCPLTQ